jgi:hypothetical protein
MEQKSFEGRGDLAQISFVNWHTFQAHPHIKCACLLYWIEKQHEDTPLYDAEEGTSMRPDAGRNSDQDHGKPLNT